MSKIKSLVFNLKLAREYLPRRQKNDNKTRGGKCLIVAGSKGMWGAAILAATAAARCGAGYVYLQEQKGFPLSRHPDFLLYDKNKKIIFNAAALGPGLANPKQILSWLKIFLKEKTAPVVLDAEALNTLSQTPVAQSLPGHWVLTPHEGELARLLQCSSEKIRKNREEAIFAAQKKYGGIFLLKGHKTLITDGKIMYVIPTGNSALAKAGTGDVLTGIITAFLSQGLNPLEAAALGAFVHGFTADLWIKKHRDVLSLMASDILTLLPEALDKIRRR